MDIFDHILSSRLISILKYKIVLFILTFSVLFSCIERNAFAVTPNLDYEEQRIKLNKDITSSENKLSEIDNTIKNIKNSIKTNTGNLNIVKSKYKVKKDINTYKFKNLSKDNLDILELVLKSNSLSELMNNLDIMTKLFVVNNKSLNDLNEKEKQLIELQELNLTKLEKANKDKKNEEEKLKSLKTELLKLKEIIERKPNEKISFNPENLLEKSNVSIEDLYKALEGTALYELAPIYVEAENTYGVNAIFLASLTAQESAWGTSQRAINDNNLTGFGVYSPSSNGINSNTKRDNILRTAKTLREKYLTVGGVYYNGLSIHGVNTMYCMLPFGGPDYNWSSSITKIGNLLIDKMQ